MNRHARSKEIVCSSKALTPPYHSPSGSTSVPGVHPEPSGASGSRVVVVVGIVVVVVVVVVDAGWVVVVVASRVVVDVTDGAVVTGSVVVVVVSAASPPEQAEKRTTTHSTAKAFRIRGIKSAADAYRVACGRPFQSLGGRADLLCMRRPTGFLLASLLLAACGLPGDTVSSSTTVPDGVTTAPTTSSTVPPIASTTIPAATTTAAPTTTTIAPAATTSTQDDDPNGRWDLEDLGVEPGVVITRPDDFHTLPPPPDSFGFVSPYLRARISSRFEGNDRALDQPISDERSITITYIPGFTIWDYEDGRREARAPGGDYMTLNEDGSWTVNDAFEWSPYGPFVVWRDAQSGYEGLLSVGVNVESYERIAGVDTAHLRWKDAPAEKWADLWVDAQGVVMRAVVDFDIEDSMSDGNMMWIIWDVLTLDPQDIGPLPPTP